MKNHLFLNRAPKEITVTKEATFNANMAFKKKKNPILCLSKLKPNTFVNKIYIQQHEKSKLFLSQLYLPV